MHCIVIFKASFVYFSLGHYNIRAPKINKTYKKITITGCIPITTRGNDSSSPVSLLYDAIHYIFTRFL